MQQQAAARTLTDVILRWVDEDPDRAAFARKRDDAWMDVGIGDFWAQVRGVAARLIAAGVGPGDRVALLSRTRYEWMLADYAIWTAGAVTVPVYETSAADQVGWILVDSGARVAVVETAEHRVRVDGVREQCPDLEQVWVIDDGDLDAGADGAPAEQVERRRSAVGPDDLATIVYTSGTTGRPKGCAITHGQLLAEVAGDAAVPGIREQLFNPQQSTLVFLPLAHILARAVQLAAIECGVKLAHTPDTQHLADELAGFRPTVVLAVPRVFEKIYNTALMSARDANRAAVFAAAERTAVAVSRARDEPARGLRGRLARSSLLARHAVFDRLVYRRIRTAMGGRIAFAVSGGAPLDAHLGHFFRGIGVNVLEGYGLTETCAATSLNGPDSQRVGTVGRAIPGSELRIDDEGELWVRGPHVFREYWNNPGATADAFDADGWFATGDLGTVDDDGFLTITGRKKDLIVTANGKNVAPAPLEDRLRAHWLIGQCVVVGDGRPYVAALLTLDPDAFAKWKEAHRRDPGADIEALRDDPELTAELQGAVDEANAAVSRAEGIRRFRLLPEDLTEENGDLTPTMKVKRSVVVQRYADQIRELYAAPRS